MSEKIWSDDAWEDYLYWQTQDRKTLKRINALIKDIERSGVMQGIGQGTRLNAGIFRRIIHGFLSFHRKQRPFL